VQRAASLNKIRTLRSSLDNLIGDKNKNEPDEADNYIDNPFTKESLKRDISLSLFNGPRMIVERNNNLSLPIRFYLRT